MSIPLLENTISSEDLESLITMYQNNYSMREIERQTGYSRFTLSRMFTRLGIKQTTGNHYRKYFFDFNYFKTIDSQDKAYWLGFMYADGCILPRDNRGYGEQTFKIQIAEKDKQTLEDFKEDMQSTYPIRYDNSHYNKNSQYAKMVLLEQRSQKTVDDLKQLGCVENKSLVLDFPTELQVPNCFLWHFIRGYFDGDGSILYSQKTDTYQISIVGTENFIKKLYQFIGKGYVFQDRRKKNSWYFSLGGNLQVIDFCKSLYKDAHRFMKRKYDRYQKLLSKYSES